MDKEQAICWFWSNFGIPAYEESSVPDNAVMPYITYSVVTDSMEYVVVLNASVWYRSTSWAEIANKAKQISDYIGGGKVIPLEEGYLYLYRGVPFAQHMIDENDMVRRIYFNVNVEYLTR